MDCRISPAMTNERPMREIVFDTETTASTPSRAIGWSKSAASS
jgi:hypothetical protein